MTNVLSRILETKRHELAELRRRALPPAPPLRPVDLRRAPGEPLRLIAEIKLRSPSAGALSRALGVAERAQSYERAGASMISVLCDAPHFDGAFEHLALARSTTQLPILCKEFIIDEVQLDAARAYGADAVLLIVRCLESARLAELVKAADERGLQSVVEIHRAEEANAALQAGARIIGVNARDLDTLAIDLDGAGRVLDALPDGVARLFLSGIHTPEQVAKLAHGRADGALIGETLMRQDDPEPLLRQLTHAANLTP